MSIGVKEKKSILGKIIIIGIVLFIFSYFLFQKFGSSLPGKGNNNSNSNNTVSKVTSGNSTMEEAYK